jgi:hypothetical protein
LRRPYRHSSFSLVIAARLTGRQLENLPIDRSAVSKQLAAGRSVIRRHLASIARLRPGGIALFVTSTGTMDKASPTAREHIGSMADLIGAARLPEASMRATAGTDVVIDVLVFQRRADNQAPNGTRWMHLVEIELDSDASETAEDEIRPLSDSYPVDGASDQEEPRGARRSTVEVNEYFATHPEMVLGEHGRKRGIYGPDPTYTYRPRPNDPPLEELLDAALARLPRDIFTRSQSPPQEDAGDETVRAGTAAEPVPAEAGGASIKEGSYFIDNGGRLMQIVNGAASPAARRKAARKCTDPTGPAVAKAEGEPLPVHSFHTLLGDLATLTRNVVRLGRDHLTAILATPPEHSTAPSICSASRPPRRQTDTAHY